MNLRHPVDIAPLVFFRIAFGVLMVWEVWRYFAHGWIDRYFLVPRNLFPYVGFEWVRPLPGNLLFWLFAVLGLLAACIALGLFYRASALLFCLGFTYVFLLDQTRYLNHFYLICLISFLMILVPAHRSFSLDVRWRKVPQSDWAPVWALWMIRFQVGAAYVFGGLAKINGDWLRGEPMAMWLRARTDFPVLGQFFGERWVALLMSYSGLLIDLLMVPLMLWRRTRLAAFAVAVAFHLLNSRLFSIGVFPWFMLASTLLFFPPEAHRRVLDRLTRKSKTGTTQPPAAAPANNTRDGWALPAFLAVYVFLQIALPLRHLLYPGNVSWTEEGHNFSWHMKLRSKRGELAMLVHSRGELWEVGLQQYVTVAQLNQIATQPDMIVLLAHYVAEDLRRLEGGPVEVYARAMVSLNGREPQLMIDSTVDLSSVRRSLKSAPYILPLKMPLRPGAVGRAAAEDQ